MKSYYMIYEKDIETAFKENNIEEYIILNSQLAVIYVDDKFNEEKLNNISQISWWQKAAPMSSLIEITNNLDNGETITSAVKTSYIDNNPYTDVSGRNVLIAIIDSGIDYLHPDFIKDGKSKILSIWDQESTKSKPPNGYIFGSEFTNEDINKAINEKDNGLSIDNTGTGTIAAGITSGMGNLNFQYKGVARESKLVVVKLRQFEGFYKKGVINYLNTDFLAAIKYVLEVGKREGLPIVINLTVAESSGAVENANILNTFELISRAGVFLVGGAGNEGNTSIHYQGKFNNINDVQDIIIQIEEQDNLDIVIEGMGPDKINAMLISPASEVGYTIKYSPDYFVYRGRFNLEDTLYTMRLTYPWILSGKERIEISLKDIKPGIWTLRVTPETLIDGGYNVYLPNKNLINENTRIIDPDSISTITNFAQGEEVITVGAYNNKTDSMWLGSSKGPIQGGTLKPDIVAPGVDIISTYIRSTYNTGTGTGVSSSVVSGVVALLIEYLIEQSDTPRISLSTEVIKTYLMIGASRKDIYNYPNISQGYGILDLKNTIESIANNL